MTTEEIMAFAFKDTAVGACYDTKQKWHGYDVYEPTFDCDEGAIVGMLDFVLVKGDTIRWSTFEESIQIRNALYPDDEE